MTTSPSSPEQPVFGLILFGGPLSGALVRDVRLANELAARGFRVHVWWVIDRPRASPLAPEIAEHWLFSGLRYAGLGRGPGDAVGRLLCRVFKDKNRRATGQNRPRILEWVMHGLMRQVARGVDTDERAMARFSAEVERAGVTHLLPMLAVLAPWAQSAVRRSRREIGCQVTFQGYELYIAYAQALGLEEKVYERMREAVAESRWPAIAVSADYRERVIEDVGVPAAALRVIPPGVPPARPCGLEEAHRRIGAKFGDWGYDPQVPLLTYLGRQDTEKGIDLLLYAATMLRRRGRRFQLAICGPTLFGSHYKLVCRQLARDLRCAVISANRVSDEMRTALFTASRAIVYPSIHREPFGMVAAEAIGHGTPAIVPDTGGVAAAIEANGEMAGLRFAIWDSGDLAEKMDAILQDDDLHRRLSEAGPRVADHYSVARLADRVLDLVEVPRTAAGRTPGSDVLGGKTVSHEAIATS